MILLLTCIFSLLAGASTTRIGFHKTDNAKGCDLSTTALSKTVFFCLSEEPGLLAQLVEHYKDLWKLATMEFVCSNAAAIASVAFCVETKLAQCIPQEAIDWVLKIFSERRLEDTLTYVCEHAADLDSSCLEDGEVITDFSHCVQKQVDKFLPGNVTLTQIRKMNATDLGCKVDFTMEYCLLNYHGRCSQAFVDILNQLFHIMPEGVCKHRMGNN